MKIEITFDEENNEFAVINIDGQIVKILKTPYGWRKEVSFQDSIGNAIASKLFGVISDLMEIRGLQGRYETWEEITDEFILECLEEI